MLNINNIISTPKISVRLVKLPRFGRGRVLKLFAAVLSFVVAAPLLSAFEARVLIVTAEFAQIDPPILTMPGDVPIGDTTGGVDLTGTVTVDMTHEDEDGTHIFYNYGPGTDPSAIPDPACGNAGPNAGGGPIGVGQTSIITLSFDGDTSVKAITCDGDTDDAHKSIINIKRYFFKGTPPSEECSDQEFVIPDNLSVLGSGDGSGKSDIYMGAIVTIKGDAHSNRNIGPLLPPLTRKILGNASAGGVVAPTITVSGTVSDGAVDVGLPTIDQIFWKTQASNGNEIPGDLIYPANGPDITLGPVSILGDLEIGSNIDVALTGPVVVGGKLIIHSNVDIEQDSSQADEFSLIIVDGQIDINPNVKFIHKGQGAFLLVGNSVPFDGVDAAIEVGANSIDQRIVVLATNGDISVHSNGHVAGVFALNGFNNSDPAVRLEPNSIVEGKHLPKSVGCGEPSDDDDDDDCDDNQFVVFGKEHGGHNDDDDCDDDSYNHGHHGHKDDKNYDSDTQGDSLELEKNDVNNADGKPSPVTDENAEGQNSGQSQESQETYVGESNETVGEETATQDGQTGTLQNIIVEVWSSNAIVHEILSPPAE